MVESYEKTTEFYCSFKNLSIVLKECYTEKLIDRKKLEFWIDKWEEERTRLFTVVKDDASVELRKENVCKENLKEMMEDQRVQILW